MAEWAVILGIALHALSGVPGLVWRRTADSGQAVSVKMAVAGSGVGMLGALASRWAPPLVGGVIRMDGRSVIDSVGDHGLERVLHDHHGG